MNCIQYNDQYFRSQFPSFANVCKYPTAIIQTFFNTATLYINNRAGGCFCGGMNLKRQTFALNAMTAHLLYLNDLIASGDVPAITTGAGVDKINVTIEPPPARNQWQYWLQTSPYGMALLALLQVATVGGCYLGGAPETAAFRRIGGLVF